jgi:Ca2+-binding RTX toxin-like protein
MPPMNQIPLRMLSVAAGCVAFAGSAEAATISTSGNALIYKAEAGEKNTPLFNENRTGSSDDFVIIDSVPLTSIPAGCEHLTEDKSYVACHLPGIAVARLTLGDGEDTAGAFFEWGARRFEVDAGPGNDRITGPDADGSTMAVNAGDGDDYVFGADGTDEIVGGPGNDDLNGHKGNDSVDGGDGNDKVNGYEGDDKVLGGSGDDQVWGDNYESPGTDLIDGGPGYDTLEQDYTTRDPDDHEPEVAITLGGGADDGRPGESDDVRGVEDLTTTNEAGIVGTDGPERLVVFQNLKQSALLGKGGDDDLKTSGGNDALDGGAGDDTIDAGYGDDRIVGGPGKDNIFADLRGGDCSPLWCTTPYGNDTVDVRDGEIDSVSCGTGQDKVAADANDVVAPDCETVLRGGGSGSSCTVPDVVGKPVGAAKKKLAKAGCGVKVSGRGKRVRRQSLRPGTIKAGGTVVRVKLGR